LFGGCYDLKSIIYDYFNGNGAAAQKHVMSIAQANVVRKR
jgi:hypothetical protein